MAAQKLCEELLPKPSVSVRCGMTGMHPKSRSLMLCEWLRRNTQGLYVSVLLARELTATCSLWRASPRGTISQRQRCLNQRLGAPLIIPYYPLQTVVTQVCGCLALVSISYSSTWLLFFAVTRKLKALTHSSIVLDAITGPVVPDGFGIGYIIKSDGLQFSVSSKHRQTPRFVNSLENTLKELKRLLNSSSNVVCASHGTQNHSNHAVQTFPYEKRVKLVEAVESSACRSEINSETNNQDNPRQQPPIAVAAAAATTTRQDRPFSNVQRKSLRFSDIKNLGLSLSFNEDTETASSSSSFSEDQKVFEC